MKLGEKISIFISRTIATWYFVAIGCVFVGWNVYVDNLLKGAPLDVFNLKISVYTIFIEIIILMATLGLRDMDRKMADKILETEKRILTQLKAQDVLLDSLIKSVQPQKKVKK